jgi:predicted alpha-1,2-mannosidase
MVGEPSMRYSLTALTLILLLSSPVAAEIQLVSDYVDPFIGTDGHGHTYPGASLPFGMVQLSPDTRLTGWDGCSAYHYSDSVVYGFSHTHLSGTGCSDYGDILLMPTTGRVRVVRGNEFLPASGYCSRFRHVNETASPGYYRVYLDDYLIHVELTVTERSGFHKYTFPRSDAANIIIDLEHRDEVIDSYIHVIDDSEIEGFRRSKAWAQDQHVYFVARFSKPFHARGIAVDDSIIPHIKEAGGKNLKAFVTYRTEENDVIMVKVGLSAVSIEGARKNLTAEITDWDFEDIKSRAAGKWEEELNKIQVSGGTNDHKIIFYTSLYHTMLNPNLFNDVDGKYRGTDLDVHQSDDFTNYTVFSLWDTYRAVHPLFTIIEPERTIDFIESMIHQYEHGGHLPVWELSGNETWCMIGYHSIPVIADAYAKGIRGFDTDKAFAAMKHSAQLDHFGLKHYRENGYIASDKDGDSVSKTLEYAYDDWCIARMASLLEKHADYNEYIQRAQYYKNIFDPSTKFMRAKSNETWHTPFDPAEVNFNYTEANCWQYSFYVPQDVAGLIQLMGGKNDFIAKLDALFRAPEHTTGRDQADITGLIGQYAHGNEPSHHMAYLYNFANEPWKTQSRVREILETMYRSSPDGLCGNEDCGQMSAWYVFSSIGFYPVTPGSDIYIIGTPIFDKAEIHLSEDKVFNIIANQVSNENIYIQSATLNGEPYGKSYLEHGDIINGGTLIFEMGAVPNSSWGSRDEDIPRSVIEDQLILPVPYVASGSRVFVDSMDVALSTVTEETNIYYTMDGSEPDVNSSPYLGPITISETTVVRAVASKAGMPHSHSITAQFNKIPSGRSIALNTSYSPQYTGGGDNALIDFITGSDNFRTGAWQGYHGVDVDAVVHLVRAKDVDRISTRFLQDQGSWIFMPASVEYAVSLDGENFEVVSTLYNDVPQKEEGPIIKEFILQGIDEEILYIRVRARNIGVCPPWHKGAGGKAWIFVDEIAIE